MDTSSLLNRLFSLEGKAALVTGASGGIGQALAVALAGAGARVGLHGRAMAALEATRSQVVQEGGEAILLPAELSGVDACRQLIRDAHAALGRLDVLVNCAGMNRRKPIAEVTADDFDAILAVNLRSAFFLSQAAHPLMRAQGGGKIIHIGSMTSFIGLGTVSVYGLTKSALAQLTKTMAVEWAPDNIQVNCLAPGFIRTPLTETSVWADPHKRQWWLDRIPARRAGVPEDLVGAALLLASPASDYLTGQVLAVDGGFLAGGSWEPPAAE
ncbi:MAG: glucose 1-dehydrogenase [Armatimonadetes bacterium]|nr:glucose 1-dehydrogenase [Armatimonadota bacterium]